MYDNQQGIYTTREVDGVLKIEVLLVHSIKPFMANYEFKSVEDAKEFMKMMHNNLAFEKQDWFDAMVKSHSSLSHVPQRFR